jgi:hypothetical protein
MLKIVGKLEFMKARAVEVCAKVGIERSTEPKNPYFHVNLVENGYEKEFS